MHLNLRRLLRTDDFVFLEIRVHHDPRLTIQDSILVQRVAHALDHAAVDLALKSQWVDRPAAVMDGDDALDSDHAGLGVDGDFGDMHAAQPAGPAGPARASDVVA